VATQDARRARRGGDKDVEECHLEKGALKRRWARACIGERRGGVSRKAENGKGLT